MELPNSFTPLSADELNDVNSVHIFMSDTQIMDELFDIQKAIHTIHPHHQHLLLRSNVSDNEIFAFVIRLFGSVRFTQRPSVCEIHGIFSEMLETLPPSQTQLFRYCLTKSLLTLESLSEDHQAHTFVVSHLWSLRCEQILCGALYPAYVGFSSIYHRSPDS